MRSINKMLLTGATALTLTATTASAAVVCNSEGDCWRVSGRPHYEPSLGLRIMSDDWRWRKGERYRWRESRHGHGYWRRGAWVEIK